MSDRGLATVDAPWNLVEEWGGQGHVTDLGVPVHWAEFGTPTNQPSMVFVHGLGGSLLNWALVAPRFALDRHIYTLDLQGFGMTPGTKRTATVRSNAALLSRFLDHIVGEPVVLVGNSMGGAISLLHTAAAPDTVSALVLVDPALPAGRSTDRTVAGEFLLNITPGVGEARQRSMRRRLTPEAQVARVLDLCFVDSSTADPRMLAAMTDLVRIRRAEVTDVEVSFLAATRSLMALLARRRTYHATMAGIECPVLLINGIEDRLVPIASARRAAARNPRWSTEFLAGVGHTPQLEVPDRFGEVVTGWLAGL